MRAIGKGSLASILAAGLHFARIIIWIAFAGLTIAMLVMPFAGGLAEFLVNHPEIDADIDSDITIGDYIAVSAYFITFGVLLYVVNRLLEILKTLRFGTPFVKENADRFKNVGFALLIGEVAKIVFSIFDAAFDADIDANSTMITWIAIIAVFVLAEVFSEGARMKEEQDLTV